MYGELQRLDGRKGWQLRFTRRFAHPPEKVWRAVTEPGHLAAWFPTTIEGERRQGARLRFTMPPEVKIPPFEGIMIAYVPDRLIEFSWGPDVIRIELRPDGDGTLFTLTDTFQEYGKAARDAAGWHVRLEKLERHFAGDASEGPEWKPLFAEYGKRFGPEAATLGPPRGHPEAQ